MKVDIKLVKTWSSKETKILLDGKDITNKVTQIHLNKDRHEGGICLLKLELVPDELNISKSDGIDIKDYLGTIPLKDLGNEYSRRLHERSKAIDENISRRSNIDE